MPDKYILITGATGFIGSHVAESILEDKKYQLVAVIRGQGEYKNAKELERKGAILAVGSFCDDKFIQHIFKKYSFEHVIHLAALRGGGAGSKQAFYDVNVLGTEILLDSSFKNRVKKFIFCSSVGVFGTIPQKVPADLMTPINGDNAYHYSKIIAEKSVQRYIDLGLNAFIVRPTITYGPGDNGFPSTLIRLVRQKMFFLTYKDITIHLLDVTSFAQMLNELIKSEEDTQRIFIVADRYPILLKDLVNKIYFYYYKKTYPSFLKLPDFIFDLMILIFRIIKNEKWLTRFELISKSWYYDTSQITNINNFIPANTEQSFTNYL